MYRFYEQFVTLQWLICFCFGAAGLFSEALLKNDLTSDTCFARKTEFFGTEEKLSFPHPVNRFPLPLLSDVCR